MIKSISLSVTSFSKLSNTPKMATEISSTIHSCRLPHLAKRVKTFGSKVAVYKSRGDHREPGHFTRSAMQPFHKPKWNETFTLLIAEEERLLFEIENIFSHQLVGRQCPYDSSKSKLYKDSVITGNAFEGGELLYIPFHNPKWNETFPLLIAEEEKLLFEIENIFSHQSAGRQPTVSIDQHCICRSVKFSRETIGVKYLSFRLEDASTSSKLKLYNDSVIAENAFEGGELFYIVDEFE
ncbi:hypothetical protein L2E82_42103 [Cichorium intybus]|uniref:Uncharacterized protein n=1 Tax=Cichorium intybus TaxID=13427 RepID=A0ACB8ZKM1_CICIN|nr:hypothetical protein L2E82_42103 [Cichorium intybus]